METITTRRYEGMFLVDSALAASDWDGVNELIKKIVTKAGAQVASINKWDERRLAYEVEGKSRGTYILVYFDCDPLKIGSIERDVQLSEQIMRILIVRTDRMSEEQMAKATPAMQAEVQAAEGAEPTEDKVDSQTEEDEDIDEDDEDDDFESDDETDAEEII